jgi:hypothetical protein
MKIWSTWASYSNFHDVVPTINRDLDIYVLLAWDCGVFVASANKYLSTIATAIVSIFRIYMTEVSTTVPSIPALRKLLSSI